MYQIDSILYPQDMLAYSGCTLRWEAQSKSSSKFCVHSSMLFAYF